MMLLASLNAMLYLAISFLAASSTAHDTTKKLGIPDKRSVIGLPAVSEAHFKNLPWDKPITVTVTNIVTETVCDFGGTTIPEALTTSTLPATSTHPATSTLPATSTSLVLTSQSTVVIPSSDSPSSFASSTVSSADQMTTTTTRPVIATNTQSVFTPSPTVTPSPTAPLLSNGAAGQGVVHTALLMLGAMFVGFLVA